MIVITFYQIITQLKIEKSNVFNALNVHLHGIEYVVYLLVLSGMIHGTGLAFTLRHRH